MMPLEKYIESKKAFFVRKLDIIAIISVILCIKLIGNTTNMYYFLRLREKIYKILEFISTTKKK